MEEMSKRDRREIEGKREDVGCKRAEGICVRSENSVVIHNKQR